MLRNALRFAAGFVAGILLWWYGTPLYARAIAAAMGPFSHGRIVAAGREISAGGGALPPVRIPFDQLTYNIVLFLALLATVHGRNAGRFAAAIAVLVASHVVFTAVDIMATYATRLGAWSNAHFNGFEQDFWMALDYGYRLGGMFAIAFACWFVVARAKV